MSVTCKFHEGSAESGGATYLQVSDDRRVVVDGFAVDSLSHAFAVEGELLHCLLLGEVGPLVEDLPRRLVLETRHVEEPLRRADVRRHGDTTFTVGQNNSVSMVHKGVTVPLIEHPRKGSTWLEGMGAVKNPHRPHTPSVCMLGWASISL